MRFSVARCSCCSCFFGCRKQKDSVLQKYLLFAISSHYCHVKSDYFKTSGNPAECRAYTEHLPSTYRALNERLYALGFWLLDLSCEITTFDFFYSFTKN